MQVVLNMVGNADVFVLGSAEYPFPGGIFQWARYRINGTGLNETERIFSESLNKVRASNQVPELFKHKAHDAICVVSNKCRRVSERFCSAFQHENTLTLATLRIFSNGLGQPHFHFNANEMGYVISGCAQVIGDMGEGDDHKTITDLMLPNLN